jgi:hypothetical protein
LAVFRWQCKGPRVNRGSLMMRNKTHRHERDGNCPAILLRKCAKLSSRLRARWTRAWQDFSGAVFSLAIRSAQASTPSAATNSRQHYDNPA